MPYNPFTGSWDDDAQRNDEVLTPGVRSVLGTLQSGARRDAAGERSDPYKKPMADLTAEKTKLGYAKQAALQVRDSFLKGEGADLFHTDPVTGKLLERPDKTYEPKLGAMIEGLRRKSEERIGAIRGALTPAVAGEFTPDALAAQKELETMEPIYKAKLDKWERIQEQLNRINAAHDENEMRLGHLAAASLASTGGLDLSQPLAPTTAAQPPSAPPTPTQATSNPASATPPPAAQPQPGGAVAPAAPVEPSRVTGAQVIKWHRELKDAEAVAAHETTGPALKTAMEQKAERLRRHIAEGMIALPSDLYRQRVVDAVRDPSILEYAKALTGTVAAGMAGTVAESGEFIARNAMKVAGFNSSSLPQQRLAEFFQAMRDEGEQWGKANIPREVQEKINGSLANSVAQGIGSTLGFIAPTSIVGRVGKLAGMGDKAIKSLMTASVALTGATSEGNNFRREAEQYLKQQLGAGEITPEEFNATLGMAEVFGGVAGSTEAFTGIGRMASRIGGGPVGRSFLRKLFEVAGTSGSKGAAAWLKGAGRKAVVDTASEMFEEAVQEFGQTAAENMFAANTFDKGREIFGTASEASGSAALSTLIVSTLTQALGLPAQSRRYKALGEAVNRGAAGRSGSQPPPAAPGSTPTPTTPTTPTTTTPASSKTPEAAPADDEGSPTAETWTFVDKAGNQASVNATGLRDAISKLPSEFKPDLSKAPKRTAIQKPAATPAPETPAPETSAPAAPAPAAPAPEPVSDKTEPNATAQILEKAVAEKKPAAEIAAELGVTEAQFHEYLAGKGNALNNPEAITRAAKHFDAVREANEEQENTEAAAEEQATIKDTAPDEYVEERVTKSSGDKDLAAIPALGEVALDKLDSIPPKTRIRVTQQDGTVVEGEYQDTQGNGWVRDSKSGNMVLLSGVSAEAEANKATKVQILESGADVIKRRDARKYGEIAYKQPATRDDYENTLYELALAHNREKDGFRGMQLRAQFDKVADEIGLAKNKRRYILNTAFDRAEGKPMRHPRELATGDAYQALTMSVPRSSDFEPELEKRRKNRSPLPPHAYMTKADIESSLGSARQRSKETRSKTVRERMQRIIAERTRQLEKKQYREAILGADKPAAEQSADAIADIEKKRKESKTVHHFRIESGKKFDSAAANLTTFQDEDGTWSVNAHYKLDYSYLAKPQVGDWYSAHDENFISDGYHTREEAFRAALTELKRQFARVDPDKMQNTAARRVYNKVKAALENAEAEFSRSAGQSPDSTGVGAPTSPSQEEPEPTGKPFTLPKHLAGAKPRYGYGEKQFTLKFESELDKALYILAQPEKSKHDAAFAKTVFEQTGMDSLRAVVEGKKVRAAIKQLAKDAEAGELTVPKVFGHEKEQTLPTETDQTSEVGGAAPVPAESGAGVEPLIKSGENSPAKMLKVLAETYGFKPGSPIGKFVAGLLESLGKANPAAFKGMAVYVLSQKEWDAHPALGSMTPESTGAYSASANTLFLNYAKTEGSSLVKTLVHEAGHFAEAYALGETFTQKQWESLDDSQRQKAWLEYAQTYWTGTSEELLNSRQARSEWVAFQFARVVRGETEGMAEGFKKRLEAFFETVRKLVNRWYGDAKLTTAELDAAIIDMLGYAEPKQETVAPPAKTTEPASRKAYFDSVTASEAYKTSDKQTLLLQAMSVIPVYRESVLTGKNPNGSKVTPKEEARLRREIAAAEKILTDAGIPLEFEPLAALPPPAEAQGAEAPANADRPAPNESSSGGAAPQNETANTPESEREIRGSNRNIAGQRRVIADLKDKVERLAAVKPLEAAKLRERIAEEQDILAGLIESKRDGVSPQVGYAPNGERDLLTDIAEYVGRLQTQAQPGRESVSELDGAIETLREGAARLLRGGTAGVTWDEAVEIINETTGRNFRSISDFQQAIVNTVAQRKKQAAAVERQNYEATVERAALFNEGKTTKEKDQVGYQIEEIGVGGTFRIKGEKFSVIGTDEGAGGVTMFIIKDGHTFSVPEGTMFYPDRKSLKKAKVEKAKGPVSADDDPFFGKETEEETSQSDWMKSANGVAPNENGVFGSNAKPQKLTFKNAKAEATIEVLELANGKWVEAVHTRHHHGSRDGAAEPLTAQLQFETKADAIRYAAEKLIEAQESIELTGSTDTQKKNARAMIEWARGLFDQNSRPPMRAVGNKLWARREGEPWWPAGDDTTAAAQKRRNEVGIATAVHPYGFNPNQPEAPATPAAPAPQAPKPAAAKPKKFNVSKDLRAGLDDLLGAPADTGELFDDAPKQFNLAAQDAKDFTGITDRQAASVEAKRNNEAAQTKLFDAAPEPIFNQKFGAKITKANKVIELLVTEFPDIRSRESLAEFIAEQAPALKPFSESLFQILSQAVDTTDASAAPNWRDLYTRIDSQTSEETPTDNAQPSPEDEQRSNDGLESNREGAASRDGGGAGSVRTDAAADGQAGRPVGRRTADEGGARPATGDAAPVGGEGDQILPERKPGTLEPEARVAGSKQPEGSGVAGGVRVTDAALSDLGVGATPREPAGAGALVEGGKVSFRQLVAEQRKAEPLEIVDTDLDNIRATLPVLLPAQHDDVLKAERRLVSANKSGMMFTNGTGTGKTYTGLGVIKRVVKRIKQRENRQASILILVPSAKKADDWRQDGAHLNQPITIVEDTTKAPGGVSVTTYANFRQNDAMLRRDYDMVVYDESHRIMENQSGEETSGYENHRLVTSHPDAVVQKATFRTIGRRPVDPGKDAPEAAKAAYLAKDLQWRDQFEKNRDKIEALAKSLIGNTKVLFLSATPFAYRENLRYADGYLFDIPKPDRGKTIAYNEPVGFDKFLVDNFGYRMRYNKLTKPEAGVDIDLMEREFADRLEREGSMSGRAIDVPFDYSREFVLLDSELGQKFDEGLEVLMGWRDNEENKFVALRHVAARRFQYHVVQSLLEALKVAQSIERMRQHIALGRKIILFHSFVNSQPAHPFRGLADDIGRIHDPNFDKGAAYEELARFEGKYPHLVNMDLGRVANPLELMREEFGDAVVFYNGDVSPKRRMDGVNRFNADNSGVNIIMGQSQSLKEGVSLHDTTGKHQRVVMNVSLPIRPTDAIQEEGRGYRVGVMSNAINEYMVLHTNSERSAFGSKINERARTAENLAMGSKARSLEDSFRNGYLNPNTDAPSTSQGVGGKANDRRESVMSDFDRAKTYYFSRMKKNARTKSAEGIDYYPTPEPVGMKMVSFLFPKGDERLLEPSVGHGAIGRFFPRNTVNVFVEPSIELVNEARIKVASGRFDTSTFEAHHVANKYHGIAMNPPFGVGGKTAIEHLAKAFKHLLPGGRVVALIPEGPAADKRFEQMAAENPDMHLVAEFGLPQVTFERAGTSVKSRIVVFDKVDLWRVVKDDRGARVVTANGDPVPHAHSYSETNARRVAEQNPDFIGFAGEFTVPSQPRRDIQADEIGELFDAFENLAVIPRFVMPQRVAAVTLPKGRDAVIPVAPSDGTGQAPTISKPKFTLHAFPHTRTGKMQYVAKAIRNYPTNEYSKVNALVKKHNGWYSSFKSGGAIPGFLFNSEADRSAFLMDYEGQFSDLHGSPPYRVDQAAPNSQSFDPIPDELLDPADRSRLAALQATLNRERQEEGAPPVRLSAQVPRSLVEPAGRAGTSGPAPTFARAVRALSAAFGKRIIFYKSDQPIGNVGATADNAANTIFVNADAAEPMHVIVGHEITHNMNVQRPDLYDWLATVIEELAPMPDDYAKKKLNQNYEPDSIPAEWIGDVLGERMDEPEFWQEFARVAGQNGGKAKQIGAMRELASFMRTWFQQMGRRLVRLFHDTHTVVKDLSELQTSIAEILAEYTKDGPNPDNPGGLPAGGTDADLATSDILGSPAQVESPAFKRWFKDSYVVDEQGKPKVVYHGAVDSFAQFIPQTWDSPSLRGSRGGFYFTENPRYASDMARLKGQGAGDNVIPAYLSIQRPLDALSYGDLRMTPQELERFLTSNGVEISQGLRKLINEETQNGDSYAFWQWLRYNPGILIPALEAAGFDGIKMRESGGSSVDSGTVWFAFKPTQIKSAIANRGTFDAEIPDILGSPRVKGDPEQEEIISSVNGTLEDRRSFMQRVKDYIEELGDWMQREAKQLLVDRFAAIKRYEKKVFGTNQLDAAISPYKFTRLTANLPSVMEYLLKWGTIEYVNGSIVPKAHSKGLIEILRPIIEAGKLELWEGYVTAYRANGLLAEDREKNFGKEWDPATNTWTWDAARAQREINRLLELGATHPEFETARLAYIEFQNSLLDLAEAADVLDKNKRALWQRSDYVPFYRIIEALDGAEARGPGKKSGVANQSANPRHLKGAPEKVAILENILRNAEHLVDASFKNIAMKRIADMAELDPELMVKIPYKAVPFKTTYEETVAALEKSGVNVSMLTRPQIEELVVFWRLRAPRGKDIVTVMQGGKPVYYRVKDAPLLRSILAIGPQRYALWMRMLMAPKKALTKLVTLDPAFMAANTIRDSFSAWVIADSPIRPGWDSVRGFAKALKNDPLKLAVMAAGGGSGHYNAIQDKELRASYLRLTRAEGKYILDTPRKIWNLYKELGRATENANRLAIAESALKNGASPAEAAFQALDIMDFGLRGDSRLLNFFLDTVPFMNARLQGLYRLGRGYGLGQGTGINRLLPNRRFATHGSLIVGATLALLAMNWDDERYWDLPEWERDLYYHFWIGGRHIRIPKPFEVGQIFSTLPERFFQYGLKDGNERTLKRRILSMIGDTFALNPVPQAAKPLLERATNTSFLTWNKIISQGDEFKSPEEQYNAYTSATARSLAEIAPNGAPEWLRSPKTIDFLIRGYLGTVGMYAVDVSDAMLRAAGEYPERPASKIGDYWLMRRFSPESDTRDTRYVSEFFELNSTVTELTHTMRVLAERGDAIEANELAVENADLLGYGPVLGSTAKMLMAIRRRENDLYENPGSLDAEQRREELERLKRQKNELAKRAVLEAPRRPSPPFNPFR